MRILSYNVPNDLFRKYVAYRAVLDSIDLTMPSSKFLYLRLTGKVIETHHAICNAVGIKYAEDGEFFDVLQADVRKCIKNNEVDYESIDITGESEIEKLDDAKKIFEKMKGMAYELAQLSVKLNQELEDRLEYEIPDVIDSDINWGNVLLYGTENGEFEDFIDDIVKMKIDSKEGE